MTPILVIFACVLFFVILFVLLLMVRVASLNIQLGKAAQQLDEMPIPAKLNDIVQQVLETINTDFRCPKCNSIIPKGARFCRHCGTELKKVKRARFLGTKWSAYHERYEIEWQCTQCGETKIWYWSKSDFTKLGPFIFIMKCSDCGHVGDALIQPKHWDPARGLYGPIVVGDPGSLSVEDNQDGKTAVQG